MSYALGVDLGTTFTAAAVGRGERVDIVGLGNRALAAPSVIYVQGDTVLAGEAAQRRASTDPDHVAREFKRRIGDPVPLIVGGAPYSPQQLTAHLLRWVVDRVTEREGGPPSKIALTHPANWGPFKRDLLLQAVRMADVGDVVLVTEPEAAAIEYASLERVETGSVVAVYDLGGGTFDAAVLRKNGAGFEVLGDPEGVEHLGGIDFDEAVFLHVLRQLPKDSIGLIDADDPASTAALQRLRQECIEAKEALSSDTDAVIPVMVPSEKRDIRLTRAELENMIRPALTQTVAALRRALRSADVEDEDLHRILLVGGSSRIPLVAQMVGEELGRPVAVDSDPKNAIALGAARVAALPEAALRPPPPPAPVAAPVPVEAPVPAAAPMPVEAPPAPPSPPPPPSAAEKPRRRTGVLLAAGAVVAVLAIVGGLLLASSGGGNGDDTTTSAETAATTEPSLLWTYDTGGRISAKPLLANGLLYVGTQVSDRVVAVDPESGELAWEFETEGSLFGGAAAGDDGTVYAGTFIGGVEGGADPNGAGFVYALDGQTGEPRWTLDVGAMVQSSPAFADGVVYVGADDNSLYAIDAGSGTTAWTFPTGGIVRSSPLVEDGVVYVGSNDGNLYAIDVASHQEIWRAPTGQADYSSPTLSDGVVYIGNNAGDVSAVAAESGEIIWTFPTGGTVGCRPAVADGSVHFGSFDGKVYAVRTEGGGERWRFEVQPEEEVVLFSSPSVVDGIVYIGSHVRRIWAIDDETGEEVWQFETDGIVGSSPLIADGALYVGSDDGNIYALELPLG